MVKKITILLYKIIPILNRFVFQWLCFRLLFVDSKKFPKNKPCCIAIVYWTIPTRNLYTGIKRCFIGKVKSKRLIEW